MAQGDLAPSTPSTASWRLAISLARRELRQGARGFRVFLACLWLGVAAIAAVGSLSQSLESGLARDGRALLGGDLDLRLSHRPASDEQLAWLAARSDLSHVTSLRAMARAAEDTGGSARPLLVQLKAVDAAYPLYGLAGLAPDQSLDRALERRDGIWGVAVEANVIARLGLAVGDPLRIGEATYRIAGTITEEPDRAGRGLTFGPTVMLRHGALAASGLLLPGSLVHHHYRLRLADSSALESFRETLETAFPEAGWRVLDARRAVPRISTYLERLTLFLSLIGLAALLVGGLGVSNAIHGYLESKTGTIATLKCLGAPSALIFRSYLLQCMSLAALACLLGLMTAAAVPFLAAFLLERSLGWELVPAVYPEALGLAGLFGLLTALLFAYLPLARARAVSPARLFRHKLADDAGRLGSGPLAVVVGLALALALLAVLTAADKRLAIYFVAGAAAAFLIFRLASAGLVALARRTTGLRQPLLRLAVANLHRPGTAAGLVLTSLGLGLSLLVIVVLIEGNLDRQLTEALPDDAPGYYFIDIQPDQLGAFEDLVGGVAGVRDLASVPMLRGRITSLQGKPVADWTIPSEIQWVFRGDRGLTWRAEPLEGAELAAGAWWSPEQAGDKLVSLDAQVGELLGLAPGDSLTINVLGRDITVEIANLRRIDWSDLSINFVMVFSPGVLAAAPQSHIATVKVDPAAEAELEQAVSDRFANISAIRVKAVLHQIAELMGRIAIVIKGMTGVALAVGVLVLAGSLAAGQERRLYDSVVLKVLGATRRRIAIVFLVEYGALGLAAALLAIGVGSLAAYFIMTQVMHAPFVLLPQPLVATALGALLLALVFGFAATYRALGRRAAVVLRND